MKKAILIVPLIILLTFLLSGCFKFDINAGIDADFTAYLTYSIELDITEVDSRYQDIIKNALNRIGWHYQEDYGFIVSLNLEDDPCILTMTRRVTNNNFEQAFISLEELLIDEDITVFMQVDMAFESIERQNRYLITAVTDIPQIIKLSNVEELSPALLQQFDDAVKTGSGTVTITLPVSEIVTSSHSINMWYNQASMEAPLSYTGQTALELSGVLNFDRDGTPAGTVDEIIREQTMFRNYAAIAACTITAIMLIILLVNVLRKKRY